jgi:ribonuclease P protein component
VLQLLDKAGRDPIEVTLKCLHGDPSAFGRDDSAVARNTMLAMEKRLRFPKSRRLVRDWEFRRVRIEGCSVHGELLTLGFLKNAESAAPSRAGFITSKRVGSAVVRNRTRRRLREIFRKHQHEIHGGIWVVTIASARAGRGTFRALEDEWLRLARRASIFVA